MNERPARAALPAADQAVVREQLAADRAATTDRVAGLSHDYAEIVEATTAAATDDEHDPEGATIAFERAQVATLLEQARDHLADLDRALERLDEGSYGRCVHCSGPIAVDRLAALPATTTCISCAAGRPPAG